MTVHQAEAIGHIAGPFLCWFVKAPRGHAVSIPSWAGVPLPQKHNGSGLLQCNPGEGGEHQVELGVGRALLGVIFFLLGKEDPQVGRGRLGALLQFLL